MCAWREKEKVAGACLACRLFPLLLFLPIFTLLRCALLQAAKRAAATAPSTRLLVIAMLNMPQRTARRDGWRDAFYGITARAVCRCLCDKRQLVDVAYEQASLLPRRKAINDRRGRRCWRASVRFCGALLQRYLCITRALGHDFSSNAPSRHSWRRGAAAHGASQPDRLLLRLPSACNIHNAKASRRCSARASLSIVCSSVTAATPAAVILKWNAERDKAPLDFCAFATMPGAGTHR